MVVKVRGNDGNKALWIRYLYFKLRWVVSVTLQPLHPDG